MIILGIDPGFGRMGFALIKKTGPQIKLLNAGCIETAKTLPQEIRLSQIHQKLNKLVSANLPVLLSIESLYFAANHKTAIRVAEARGIALLTAGLHGLKVYEYTPPQVKRAITGDGRADKKAVQKITSLNLKINNAKLIDDASDAIALAITAAYDPRTRFFEENKK